MCPLPLIRLFIYHSRSVLDGRAHRFDTLRKCLKKSYTLVHMFWLVLLLFGFNLTYFDMHEDIPVIQPQDLELV